jgi:hypothetical protein
MISTADLERKLVIDWTAQLPHSRCGAVTQVGLAARSRHLI